MAFSVTILGNSSAKPTPSAHPSAQVVNLNEQYYLVDAGEGVQQQLIRRGINPLRLRAVFISHLHGDHCYGLFPLISTLGLEGKRTPLDIYAPAPMGEILDYHAKYFLDDIPYEIKYHQVDTTKHQIIMENNTLEVWSVPLRHRVPTAGYHFKEKQPGLNVDKFKIERYGLSIAQIVALKRGEDIVLESGEVMANEKLTYRPYEARSYAYLSDTNYSAKAAERVRGVDLLYHETTYARSEEQWAKGRGHSTTTEAARVAQLAEAKRLIIGHFSSRYKNHDLLAEECREIFPNTDIAREGDTFFIDERR
ncbi:MAG: ribonuclease Z [Alistipes sp.]|nr:ribonuclease Z [Alistipes sp.]MBR5584702.1 ribonuclease Z [Alistipes sp.]